jgi:DNA ligase-1
MSKLILLSLTVLYLTVQVFAVQAETPPQVQLANVYNQDNVSDISNYLVSEKYDGVRAIWTGEALLTRQGNPISAPKWFTDPLPAVWLDGELWTRRQNFDALSGIVRTQTPDDGLWREVNYMIFDMPDADLPFEQRYNNYSRLVEHINAEHIQAVKQQRFDSNHALSENMQTLVENGGEV